MKLKKEYMILFGVIAVLLVFLLTVGRKNRMSYRVPDLDRVSEEDISKIEISSGGDTIILTGKDSGWEILPQEYAADPDKISNMLDIVANLKLTELAAEARDYQRYELDEENRISVKAFIEDNLVRSFDVGKVSSTYRHTFVRIDEDPRVYVARESFRSTFEVESGDLRDKTVMTFDSNEVTAVHIEQEDSSLLFNKTVLPSEALPSETEEEQPSQPAEDQQAWMTEEGIKGSKADIDSILSQLSDLSCDSFIEDKSVEEFTEPVYSIKITGSKDYSLQIFAKDEEADEYPTLSSETPYVFFLATWKAENIMKKPDELVEAEEEKGEEKRAKPSV